MCHINVEGWHKINKICFCSLWEIYQIMAGWNIMILTKYEILHYKLYYLVINTSECAVCHALHWNPLRALYKFLVLINLYSRRGPRAYRVQYLWILLMSYYVLLWFGTGKYSFVHDDVMRLKCFPHNWLLCEGNPLVTDGFPSQRTVMWSFDDLFDVSLNMLLDKKSSCW